jgi:predicted RNA-binding Zn-ribbon protein involved in translation (DUF1610 family)
MVPYFRKMNAGQTFHDARWVGVATTEAREVDDNPTTFFHFFGFGFGRGSADRGTSTQTFFFVPHWSIVAMSVYAIARLLLWRARQQEFVCAKCGYDLRATPRRCPECGTVPVRGLP